MNLYRPKERIKAEPMSRAEYAKTFQDKIYAAVDVEGYHVHHIESGYDEWRNKEDFDAVWERADEEPIREGSR